MRRAARAVPGATGAPGVLPVVLGYDSKAMAASTGVPSENWLYTLLASDRGVFLWMESDQGTSLEKEIDPSHISEEPYKKRTW